MDQTPQSIAPKSWFTMGFDVTYNQEKAFLIKEFLENNVEENAYNYDILDVEKLKILVIAFKEKSDLHAFKLMFHDTSRPRHSRQWMYNYSTELAEDPQCESPPMYYHQGAHYAQIQQKLQVMQQLYDVGAINKAEMTKYFESVYK